MPRKFSDEYRFSGMLHLPGNLRRDMSCRLFYGLNLVQNILRRCERPHTRSVCVWIEQQAKCLRLSTILVISSWPDETRLWFHSPQTRSLSGWMKCTRVQLKVSIQPAFKSLLMPPKPSLLDRVLKNNRLPYAKCSKIFRVVKRVVLIVFRSKNEVWLGGHLLANKVRFD